jgi:DMSO/TMAO reductase YedYZ molybdopterin-dependent catalytic subunit
MTDLGDAGKHPDLNVHGESPLVAETPASLLDERTTPIPSFFVRNNGGMPTAVPEPERWTLTIDGEVERPTTWTLAELRALEAPVSHHMVLECGGNGRAGFEPQTRGNQWGNGGAGCALWTGIPLARLLDATGLRPSASYTAHFSIDRDVSGTGDGPPISRGVRIAKALEPHTLVVWGMNGTALPHIHGGPLRLIVPGWPGSASQKWLSRITILDHEHDGPGMTGTSYRVPIRPMSPEDPVDPANFRVLESMPVRSIITSPADNARLPAGSREIGLRGAAWAGDLGVARVDVSIDAGATWHLATLGTARNKYDWQRWTASVALDGDGYYEVWARATDSVGTMQPHRAVRWNPQGYGSNAMHHVSVRVG